MPGESRVQTSCSAACACSLCVGSTTACVTWAPLVFGGAFAAHALGASATVATGIGYTVAGTVAPCVLAPATAICCRIGLFACSNGCSDEYADEQLAFYRQYQYN